MNKNEALDLLFQASGLAPLNRNEHLKVQEAYQLLKSYIDENSNNKPK